MTQLPAGTKVYLGPPAKPMTAERPPAIGAALGELAGIREAHLPMVYIQGKIAPPAQVLVVVYDEHASRQLPNIAESLRRIPTSEVFLHVCERRPGDTTLPTVTSAGCALNLRAQAERRRT